MITWATAGACSIGSALLDAIVSTDRSSPTKRRDVSIAQVI